MTRHVLAAALVLLSLPAFAEDANSYKPTSFSDFLLDYKTYPDHTRIAITGYYERTGSTEILVSDPYSKNLWVMLYMETAARAGRKRLLECIDHHSQGCRATFLAHTGCSTTKFGVATSDPCLIVDDIRDPPHHIVPSTEIVPPGAVMP